MAGALYRCSHPTSGLKLLLLLTAPTTKPCKPRPFFHRKPEKFNRICVLLKRLFRAAGSSTTAAGSSSIACMSSRKTCGPLAIGEKSVQCVRISATKRSSIATARPPNTKPYLPGRNGWNSNTTRMLLPDGKTTPSHSKKQQPIMLGYASQSLCCSYTLVRSSVLPANAGYTTDAVDSSLCLKPARRRTQA